MKSFPRSNAASTVAARSETIPGSPRRQELLAWKSRLDPADDLEFVKLVPDTFCPSHNERKTRVERTILAAKQTIVYNLRVATDHTYFVGDAEWGFSLWVHNTYIVTPNTAKGTFEVVDDATKVVYNSYSTLDEANAVANARNAAIAANAAKSVAIPKAGELFERTFQTPKGPVTFLAEVEVDGTTLWLKDIVVYGEGTAPLTGLRAEVFAARKQLIDEAKSMGFKRLRLSGKRVASSSSANPGHIVDLFVDLTK